MEDSVSKWWASPIEPDGEIDKETIAKFSAAPAPQFAIQVDGDSKFTDGTFHCCLCGGEALTDKPDGTVACSKCGQTIPGLYPSP